jgi:hypothetical protein
MGRTGSSIFELENRLCIHILTLNLLRDLERDGKMGIQWFIGTQNMNLCELFDGRDFFGGKEASGFIQVGNITMNSDSPCNECMLWTPLYKQI